VVDVLQSIATVFEDEKDRATFENKTVDFLYSEGFYLAPELAGLLWFRVQNSLLQPYPMTPDQKLKAVAIFNGKASAQQTEATCPPPSVSGAVRMSASAKRRERKKKLEAHLF